MRIQLGLIVTFILLYSSTSFAADIFVEDYTGSDEERIKDAIKDASPGDTIHFGTNCKSFLGGPRICNQPTTWEIQNSIGAINGVSYNGFTRNGNTTLKLIGPNSENWKDKRSIYVLSFEKKQASPLTTQIRYLDFDLNRDNQAFNWEPCTNQNDCLADDLCLPYKSRNYCFPKSCDDDDKPGEKCEPKHAALWMSSTPTSKAPVQKFLVEHSNFNNSVWKGMYVWHHAHVTANHIKTSNNHNGVLVGGHNGDIALYLSNWTSVADRVGFRGEIESYQGPTVTVYNKCDNAFGPSLVGSQKIPNGATSKQDIAEHTATISITNSTVIDPIGGAASFAPHRGDGAGSSFYMNNVVTYCDNNPQCDPSLVIKHSYGTVALDKVDIGSNSDNIAINMVNFGNDIDITNSTLHGSILAMPLYYNYNGLANFCDAQGNAFTSQHHATLDAEVYLDNVLFTGQLHSIHESECGQANCNWLATDVTQPGKDTIAILGRLAKPKIKNVQGQVQYSLFDVQFDTLPDYIMSMHGGKAVVNVNTRVNALLAPILASGNLASTNGQEHETTVRWERRVCQLGGNLCPPADRWEEKTFDSGGFSILDMSLYDFVP